MAFKRKLYLHWYYGEGMDEMEFTEAEECLLGIIDMYKELEGKNNPDEIEDGDIRGLRL